MRLSLRVLARVAGTVQSRFSIPAYQATLPPISLWRPVGHARRAFSSQSPVTAEPVRTPVALIIGAGEGGGQAVARKFAKEGLCVCVVRRPKAESMERLKTLKDDIEEAGGRCHAFGVDARREEDVATLVEGIERDIGPIDVCVFNIGANVRFSVLDTSVRVYTKVWEMACLSGFISAREVARRMVHRQRGTIIFTGATASMRGSNGFCAFAGAKFGLRALAQSMARELGPRGIHVAHVVIDGMVDTPWIHDTFPEIYEARAREEGIVRPDQIAQQYWNLYSQEKGAWTFEMDLRPWVEPW